MSNSRTIPDKMKELAGSGKEVTVYAGDELVTFTPEGLSTYIEDSLSTVFAPLPAEPAAYSIDPAAISAVLVAAGLMLPEE